MKNLTAHYNIYYNAKELLNETERNIRNSNQDDFYQQLPIFILPSNAVIDAQTEILNEVVLKANRIALEKYESNWVDDAFLLLAKAEYYKGNFFIATEYFSYVAENFPEEKNNTVEALVWQGKSFFAINEFKKADSILQLAYNKNLKHERAELNAALAQSFLYKNDLEKTEEHLQKAINFSTDKYEKIRWTYVLAQIQEENNKAEQAYLNYGKVVKSNAAFEMSFNANLSQIRLKQNANGVQFDKIATLNNLLKEDKNFDFKDQIHYQIGEAYEEIGNLNNAIESYQTSTATTPGSNKQKALSFLRLAEINFDSLKNYSASQLYYDSTLTFLPTDYPEYSAISLKAKNLEYLSKRLTLIDTERELLSLAKLSEEDRNAYIDKKIRTKFINDKEAIEAKNQTSEGFESLSTTNNKQKESTFYFDNPSVIGQGSTEFKKKWGNRKLADNWRISAGVSNISNLQNLANQGNPSQPGLTEEEEIEQLKTSFSSNIPLHQEAQATSLTTIRTARYEIAQFYKNELHDNQAAIKELELLLEDYTINDPKVAELYFLLYRLNESEDKQKANLYKNELIKVYPESSFAKSLSNPNYGEENLAELKGLKNAYATFYDKFQQKKYQEVISDINSLENKLINHPEEKAQFDYLKALSIGYTQKANVFVPLLEDIVKKYPAENQVAELAKKQLSFINENKNVFYSRATALTNFDANERISKNYDLSKTVEKNNKEKLTDTESRIVEKKEETTTNKKEEAIAKVEEPKKENEKIVSPLKPEVEKPKIIAFNNTSRTKHFIILDVKDASLNVAKPFASLTKYFYSKFGVNSVNLSIRTIGTTNKLIIVRGPFNNKEQADNALKELSTSIQEIVELKPDVYRTYVISDLNLLLVNDAESLNQYLNFNK